MICSQAIVAATPLVVALPSISDVQFAMMRSTLLDDTLLAGRATSMDWRRPR